MMAKTMIATIAILFAAAFALSAEQDIDHGAHHRADNSANAGQASTEYSGVMPMKQMQESMQKMHSQMAEIHRTQDPEKRDELIEAHMKSMQDMMQNMMKMMQGGGMMAGQMGISGAGHQAGEGGDQKLAIMSMMARQENLEKRMDMMHVMMDQMLQSQAAAKKSK